MRPVFLLLLLTSCANPATYKSRQEFARSCQDALQARYPDWVIERVQIGGDIVGQEGRRSAAATAELGGFVGNRRILCIQEDGQMRVERP